MVAWVRLAGLQVRDALAAVAQLGRALEP